MIRNAFNVVSRIYQFFEDYRYGTFGVFLLTVTYTLFEGLGITVLIPLFNQIQEGSVGSESDISRVIGRGMQVVGIPVTLLTLLLLILAMYLLKNFFFAAAEYSQASLIYGFEKNIRDELTERILTSDWEHFTHHRRGFLINDLVAQASNAMTVLKHTLKVLVQFTTSFVYILIACLISVKVTLGAVALTIISGLCLYPLIRRSKARGRDSLLAQKDFTDLIEQYLTGFQEIKSYNTVHPVLEQIQETTESIFNARINISILQIISRVFVQMFGILLVVSFLYVTIGYLDYRIQEVAVIVILLHRVYKRSNKFRSIQRVAERAPSMDEVQKGLDQFGTHQEEAREDGKECSFQQSICFDQVSFCYTMDKKDTLGEEVLTDLSFEIQKNSFVGIVGESGAGKSTLVNLLLGLLEPRDGSILVDGMPLSEMNKRHWRGRIGFVPQESFLINDTIENNIRFFRDIDRDRIVTAAKTANAHEFIQSMENGYESGAGEEGVKLSGGQKQRIALARALAGSPDLLLLDEATSELDSHSEQKIKNAFGDLQGNMTMVAIAHRLTSVMDADQIIVLDSGELVEKGPAGDLMERNGPFARMVQKQHGDHFS